MIWNVPPVWQGSTVVVIGGGPSLNEVEVDRAAMYPTIGVNNAFRFPWVVVCYYQDCDWYWEHGEELAEWPGWIVTSCGKLKDYEGIYWLRKQGKRKLAHDSSHIGDYTNSGAGAINLAYLMGAARIVLVGFDGEPKGNEHNWHDEHVRHADPQDYAKFRADLESAAAECEQAGVEVFNCSPGSVLGIPQRALEEVCP